MKNGDDHYIAGWKTRADWEAIRGRLLVGDPDAWHEAFTAFYETRLNLRYLHPIRVLQDNGTFQGEGFAIVAIQCSLIEFLESTEQGINYRHVPRGGVLGPYEYSASRDIFVAFLRDQAPFSATFNEDSAKDFYIGVRCGLLHEARTRNGWRIWAKSPVGMVADVANRIVYRDNFQEALLVYIKSYGEKLPHEPQLQRAFIRKFNSLCE
ncbi:MAG TPA: hypothetical protein VMW50_02295 [Dehalococcoidia bacterium]|nr:hypothetical protein [Dehalococcoidia bacterium]